MADMQSNDPLHGVTLETILRKLVHKYGWSGLAKRIDIRCFKSDASINSSLTFLRRTPWARKQVEDLFVNSRFWTREPGSAEAELLVVDARTSHAQIEELLDERIPHGDGAADEHGELPRLLDVQIRQHEATVGLGRVQVEDDAGTRGECPGDLIEVDGVSGRAQGPDQADVAVGLDGRQERQERRDADTAGEP